MTEAQNSAPNLNLNPLAISTIETTFILVKLTNENGTPTQRLIVNQLNELTQIQLLFNSLKT